MPSKWAEEKAKAVNIAVDQIEFHSKRNEAIIAAALDEAVERGKAQGMEDEAFNCKDHCATARADAIREMGEWAKGSQLCTFHAVGVCYGKQSDCVMALLPDRLLAKLDEMEGKKP